MYEFLAYSLKLIHMKLRPPAQHMTVQYVRFITFLLVAGGGFLLH
jgi:hypothetical protein